MTNREKLKELFGITNLKTICRCTSKTVDEECIENGQCIGCEKWLDAEYEIKEKEEQKIKDIEDPKTFLKIVVNNHGEKPYYEIEYLDKDGNLHTGYGSYSFELVKRWKATEFEYYK